MLSPVYLMSLSMAYAGDTSKHRDDIPHRSARPPAGRDAGGLGGQQRNHRHRRCPGQQAGAQLEDQERRKGQRKYSV